MLRVSTPLETAVEDVVHRTIGCCITSHRELGPGLIEIIYQRAVEIELREAGLAYEREKPFPVCYRGRPLYVHRLDLVVEKQVVVELKAVERLHPVHRAQALSALRISGLRVALLINFNVPILPDGIKRFVL